MVEKTLEPIFFIIEVEKSLKMSGSDQPSSAVPRYSDEDPGYELYREKTFWEATKERIKQSPVVVSSDYLIRARGLANPNVKELNFLSANPAIIFLTIEDYR